MTPFLSASSSLRPMESSMRLFRNFSLEALPPGEVADPCRLFEPEL